MQITRLLLSALHLIGWLLLTSLLIELYYLFQSSLPLFFCAVVPLIFYVLIIRPWILTWGTNEYELETFSLPDSDHSLEVIDYACIHAITIRKSADEVWPWLMQMGQGRAGFYSYRWIDLFLDCPLDLRHKLVAKWQYSKVGDFVVYRAGLPRIKVTYVNKPFQLNLGNWHFYLVKISQEKTRLIIRTHGCYQPNLGFPINFVVWHIFWEIGKFFFERKMLVTIKQLVESCEQSPNIEKVFLGKIY